MSEGQKYHCGPDRWPSWIRAIISQDPLFNEACEMHDEDYTLMSQDAADKKMYDYLVKRIGPWWLSPYRRFKAWVAYRALKRKGKKAWIDANKDKVKK